MKNVLLLYDKFSTWERDYIKKELLDGIKFTTIDYGDHIREGVKDTVKIVSIIINNLKEIINTYKKTKKSYSLILVMSSQKYFKVFSEIVSFVKPDVFIYLSDEGIEDINSINSRFIDIAKNVKLILHQYNQYTVYKNNEAFIHIPTGYVSTMLDGVSFKDIKIKPMAKRKYIAAFVGQVKADRQEMLNEFNAKFDKTQLNFFTNHTTWYINELKILPKQVHEIYSDAKFIPIGRGFYSLDCYRINEAIVAGAIPVIVGQNSEINNTFWYQGRKLPAVFAKTWKEACIECEKLIKDANALQKKRDECVEWFKTYCAYVNSRIKDALSIDTESAKPASKKSGGVSNVYITDIINYDNAMVHAFRVLSISALIVVLVMLICKIIGVRTNDNHISVCAIELNKYKVEYIFQILRDQNWASYAIQFDETKAK